MFVEESAVGSTRGPADLVLYVGATHALSEAEPPQSTIDALYALRRLVSPGGRVLPDDHLSIWLRGSRGCMGLAYLTLIPV